MPRRSAEAIATEAAILPGLRRIERLHPPADLSAAQQAHFAAVVASKPADFFKPVDVPLLVQLCRHLARADEIERKFRANPFLSVGDYDDLSRLADRETKTVTSLMTRLRLTPQSRYRPDSAKHDASGRGDPLDALLNLDAEDDA
ncbi:MAG TPA: hypothetical protein VJ673_24510 [Aromatoleum sp.]|uniref:hypothetical protein n=1 Tax=Aromatoleum sp. TaxID=2307007 RepID=UPI002B47E87D|nr:hypothetical protein [Aromatoleum sp.]HJV28861.1 hypothetical protein [Aromatoleum sp.]